MEAEWRGSVCWPPPWAHSSPSAHTMRSHTQGAAVPLSRGSAGPALLPQGRPRGGTVPLWSGLRVGLGPEGAPLFSAQQKYTVSHKGIF